MDEAAIPSRCGYNRMAPLFFEALLIPTSTLLSRPVPCTNMGDSFACDGVPVLFLSVISILLLPLIGITAIHRSTNSSRFNHIMQESGYTTARYAAMLTTFKFIMPILIACTQSSPESLIILIGSGLGTMITGAIWMHPTPTMPIIDSLRVTHLTAAAATLVVSTGATELGHDLVYQCVPLAFYLGGGFLGWYLWGTHHTAGALEEIDFRVDERLFSENKKTMEAATRSIGTILQHEHERGSSAPLLTQVQDLLVDTRSETHLVAMTAVIGMFEQPPLRLWDIKMCGIRVLTLSDRWLSVFPECEAYWDGLPPAAYAASELAAILLEKHAPIELHFDDFSAKEWLTPAGCGGLTKFLASRSAVDSLEILNLNGSRIGPEGAILLSKNIENLENLKELHVANCGLKSKARHSNSPCLIAMHGHVVDHHH